MEKKRDPEEPFSSLRRWLSRWKNSEVILSHTTNQLHVFKQLLHNFTLDRNIMVHKTTNIRFLPTGAPNDNFRKNICSEDDLRSRIFETFVVKFLACLPLLGFSNIYEMV